MAKRPGKHRPPNQPQPEPGAREWSRRVLPRMRKDPRCRPAHYQLVTAMIELRRAQEPADARKRSLKHSEPLLVGYDALAAASKLSRQTVIDCLRELISWGHLVLGPDGRPRVTGRRACTAGRTRAGQRWRKPEPVSWSQRRGGRIHANAYYAAGDEELAAAGAPPELDFVPPTAEEIERRRRLARAAFEKLDAERIARIGAPRGSP